MLTFSTEEFAVLSTAYDWAFEGRTRVLPCVPAHNEPCIETFHSGVPDFLIAGELADQCTRVAATLALLRVKGLASPAGPVEVLGPPPGQAGIVHFPEGEWWITGGRKLRAALEIDDSTRRISAVRVSLDGKTVLRRRCASINGLEVYGTYWLPTADGVNVLSDLARSIQQEPKKQQIGYHAISSQPPQTPALTQHHLPHQSAPALDP